MYSAYQYAVQQTILKNEVHVVREVEVTFRNFTINNCRIMQNGLYEFVKRYGVSVQGLLFQSRH